MGTTRSPWPARLIAGAGGAASLAAGGALVARAGLTLDIGLGRRVRPLGPIRLQIAAPPEVVFDVIAAPYLGKTPRAMRGKLQVLERGSDLVLAAHFTPLGRGLTVTTVETVRFERPHRISFRLVKGPVPYVLERYELQPRDGATDFAYTGELERTCGGSAHGGATAWRHPGSRRWRRRSRGYAPRRSGARATASVTCDPTAKRTRRMTNGATREEMDV